MTTHKRSPRKFCTIDATSACAGVGCPWPERYWEAMGKKKPCISPVVYEESYQRPVALRDFSLDLQEIRIYSVDCDD